MHVVARHHHIERALQSEAAVSTLELARALRVSQETIRRDLIQLEEKGRLRRVYGGAVMLHRQQSSEPPFTERARINTQAKQVVGNVAARIAAESKTIFIDVGTTAQAAARSLAPFFTGTIVSHSLLVALEISSNSQADLILAPGRLRRGEWSLSGTATHNFIKTMHFDIALLSCGGVDGVAGATDFDFDDAEVKRTVAQQSTEAFILADSSKHGVVGSHSIGDWFDVNGIITDRDPPHGLLARIKAAGGSVRLPTEERTMKRKH